MSPELSCRNQTNRPPSQRPLANFVKNSKVWAKQALNLVGLRENSTDIKAIGRCAAFDGITLSNTYMLEEKFGWTGIVCEPNRTFAPQLLGNRPSCAVDSRCVWSVTGETIAFTETTDCGELSTVTQFTHSDSYDSNQSSLGVSGRDSFAWRPFGAIQSSGGGRLPFN
jgi:hypothetical protein